MQELIQAMAELAFCLQFLGLACITQVVAVAAHIKVKLAAQVVQAAVVVGVLQARPVQVAQMAERLVELLVVVRVAQTQVAAVAVVVFNLLLELVVMAVQELSLFLTQAHSGQRVEQLHHRAATPSIHSQLAVHLHLN